MKFDEMTVQDLETRQAEIAGMETENVSTEELEQRAFDLEAIKAELEAMRPAAPVAETEEGFYSEYIPITFRSADATLYCNFEGDYPSTWDGAYTEPYALPAGVTEVWAIAVAKNGLVSPVTTLSYTVGGVIEPAVFVDAVMEEAVRSLLNLDDDYMIFTNDLWEISEFTVPENVGSYEDLKLLPYVKKLTLQGVYLAADAFGYIYPIFVKDKYYSTELSATLNLKNRFFPVVEVGIGISELGNTLEALDSRSIILLGICSATIGKAHLGWGGCIGSIELGDTCATEECAECHEES